MVVEVLVAAGDGGDPLGQQGPLLVGDQLRQPGVGDGRVEGVEEPEACFELAEQQEAGVGGEPAAAEVGEDGLASEAGEAEGLGVTVCHSGGLALGGVRIVLTQTLQGVRPPRIFHRKHEHKI